MTAVLTPAVPGPVSVTLRLDRGYASTDAHTYRYAITYRVTDRALGMARAEHVMVSLHPDEQPPGEFVFAGSAYARGVAAPAQMWMPAGGRAAAWLLNDGKSLIPLPAGDEFDAVRELIRLYEGASERASHLIGA